MPEEYRLALDQCIERVSRLDELLEAQVPQWCHYPAVQALMAMRGFQLIAATVLVAEIGDIHRFAHDTRISARSRFLGTKETHARLTSPLFVRIGRCSLPPAADFPLIRFHSRRGPEFLCLRLTPRSYINAQGEPGATLARAPAPAGGVTAVRLGSAALGARFILKAA